MSLDPHLLLSSEALEGLAHTPRQPRPRRIRLRKLARGIRDFSPAITPVPPHCEMARLELIHAQVKEGEFLAAAVRAVVNRIQTQIHVSICYRVVVLDDEALARGKEAGELGGI